jgi:esterase/lipase superfamily enzyme
MKNLPVTLLKAKNIWAIPLKNTDRLHWSDLENFGNVTFICDDVNIGNPTKRQDITIAISQKNPTYSAEKVKRISTSILNFSSIKKDDAILGVVGTSRVHKIGFVTHKDPLNEGYKMKLTIKWIDAFEPIEAPRSIFKETLDIEKVAPKNLEYLKSSVVFFPDKNHVFFNDLDTKEHVMAAQQHHVYEKMIINDNPKEDSGGRINLFYGTNRNKTGSSDMNDYFGDELSTLQFGLCEVAIPKGHIQGEIERPGKILWAFELPEKTGAHVMLTKITELQEQDFIKQLADGINSSGEKAGLIFIHGYNNTFAEAARRAAQIAWDVPFNGVTGFFSWPSAGKTLNYFKDIEHADVSIPQLEYFIEKIVLETKIEKLHIIAHSMGNRVLTVTLNQLSKKETFKPKLKVLHQIILAAPDIDKNVFKTNILPQFKTIGNRRTIYASDQDKALNISEKARIGLSRLGDGGESVFVAEGFDTVDASNVRSTGSRHSYIFETKELLTDLFYLLNQGLDPLNRRLRARNKETLKYWLFPE